MLWLIVIVSAYFIFALVSLGDKYLLMGPPNPKNYSFYVGVLWILALFLIPFVNFYVPDLTQIFLCFSAGAIYIFALLGLFEGLEKFEASRIVPAIGGILPIFTFVLVYLFSWGKEILNFREIGAFILLISGSIFIVWESSKKISLESLKISFITAFLFALTFVLTKYVYLAQPFWNGFVWIRIGGFLTALCFLFFKEVRKEIFFRKFTFNKKTGTLFLLNQGVGAGAFILQNWAIALAGLAYLAIINALQGIQYIFLFIFTILFSLKSPKILKEEISKKNIIQKIIAIVAIGVGLAILAPK